MTQLQIEFIRKKTLRLSFPYAEEAVQALRRLENRRWNPQKKCWDVHLSHLREVMRIFDLKPADLDPKIIECFRADWMQTELRVELGPLKGRLTGNGAPLRAIDEATSFEVPGHQFAQLYKTGKWDGKRHLFSLRTQAFPTGLWPRVRTVLEAHQTPYTLSEPPPATKRGAEEAGALAAGPAQVPLRDYQEAAVAAALEARRGIIQIATGGGKTLLAAHLIRRINRPAFFFVHTLDLLYQTAQVISDELGLEVGILGDGHANLRAVTVATVQTAMRAVAAAPALKGRKKKAADDEDDEAREERLTHLDAATCRQVREAIESAGAVIFDECHHVPAESFYKIAMLARSAPWRIGLSATPWRDDGHDLLLEAALGATVHQTLSSDLIDRGYLVPPRIVMAPAPGPRLRGKSLTYPECYQAAIVENRERNRAIAAQARAWAEQGLSILILVTQVTHGLALQELLPEANFAHGSVETSQRQRFLKELERKLHPVLIATTLADEGLDVPSLDAVILGGGGKSPTKAYQRIGRALRLAPEKKVARVLDFNDDSPYLREHSAARLKLYRMERRFMVETLPEFKVS